MEPNGQKRSEKFWADHITRWETSGISRRRYCVNEGLSYWTFRERQKRQGKATRPGSDLVQLPLEIIAQNTAIHPGIDLLLPDKTTIRVNRGFDGELLRDLLRELGVRQ